MSSTTTGVATVDGSSDVIILDKLDRHEPLLPGRRALTRKSSSVVNNNNNNNRLSREKSNYGIDEQLFIRANTGGSTNITAGLTQEALNELVPASRIASRKLYHDIVLRKSSAIGGHVDSPNEHNGTRRIINPNSLIPIKPSLSAQRGNILILQQQQQHKTKTRSLPNSTLDHANQNGFHLPHDPYGTRTPKNPSRTSHLEHSKKSQQNSPVRYNPGKFN